MTAGFVAHASLLRLTWISRILRRQSRGSAVTNAALPCSMNDHARKHVGQSPKERAK